MKLTKNLISEFNSPILMPKNRKRIVIIGAGGIIKDAHLPAYKKYNFDVEGIYDIDIKRSKKISNLFSIKKVFSTLDEALETNDVVFDIAVPPSELINIIEKLKDNSICLFQKPFGVNLKESKYLKKICEQKKIIAAVNFQLKFSPMMMAAKKIIDSDFIGNILDVEVNLNTHTPWELWPFLKDLERVEIPLHSIHYLDFIRSILGMPNGVYSKSVKHINVNDLADSKSSIILDYGKEIRCCLSLNHNHYFGEKHSSAFAKIEGHKGAIFIELGLLLDYPKGKPEKVEVISKKINKWNDIPLNGSWFPDAFAGTMAELQRYVNNEITDMSHSLDNSIGTMKMVEACKLSDESGSIKI